MKDRYQVKIIPRTLIFKEQAGTSRGVYTTRQVYYAFFEALDGSASFGIGEFAPLPKLSCDDLPNYVDLIRTYALEFAQTGVINREELRPYPSILFGLEMAERQLEANSSFALWGDSPFALGIEGIQINGLIWMNSKEKMFSAIKDKLDKGFHCIKLKVGAIDFEEELSLIKYIRKHYRAEEIELRLDANGAFSLDTVQDKLNRLADYVIHSIEQPIACHQWEALAKLCQGASPIAIALDEELIAHHSFAQREELLQMICPQYIILKPSLHGGFSGADEWIRIAEKYSISYWATSALESNLGLNAIAHWIAQYKPNLPQGLGTGMLYTNNIELPLEIKGERLYFDPQITPSIDL